MARARVSSFITTFGQKLQHPASPSPSPQPQEKSQPEGLPSSSQRFSESPVRQLTAPSTPPRTRTERSSSKPVPMLYQPPSVDAVKDTPPELLPIFTFLNSHANKLYQEGYFLKLNDLDISGRPNADRNWAECFAQLVGTVLSLWDAAALDAAGQDGEVAPTFINLADASIKMIETLPTRNEDVHPLQNVLSISTAGKNRYLLHFNSFHSLTQWTAGIRLSMFENSSLEELYTGSLIAGKGKLLNNIRVIMERSRFRTEDWVRVRFGAGTPWRRCWCVIDPPNEKDFQREQKSLKKKSVYDRPAVVKGDIKFYETKKTKKVTPIATITDAYSAYAIYPQSKPLIDQSTLVKVEGRITIHSNPESKSEGFVFVMPEVHPAVSGFEMMLRWLFPVYDTFGLYGRPARLIADTFDSRGLMFAMPKERRYGYLDIQDVAALVCKEGSQNWSEEDFRKQLKDATSKRLSTPASRTTSRQGSRKGVRSSLPAGTNLRYEDGASIYSTPSRRRKYGQSTDTVYATPQKNDTAPQGGSLTSANYHARSMSETLAFANSPRKRQEQHVPSRLLIEEDSETRDGPPPAPAHSMSSRKAHPGDIELPKPRASGSDEPQSATVPETEDVGSDLRPQPPPTPVEEPPAFLHSPGERPSMRPNASPEMRRANSRMSIATLSQLVDASKSGATSNGVAAAGPTAAWNSNEGLQRQDQAWKGVNPTTNHRGSSADQELPPGGLVAGLTNEIVSTHSPGLPAHSQSVMKPDELIRSSTDISISRKPVGVDHLVSSGSPGAVERESARTRTKSQSPKNPPPSPEDLRHLQPGEVRNADPNDDIDTSVDHTSARQSSESKRSSLSVPKQRAGVLRTVGNPNHTDATPSNLQNNVSNGHPETSQNNSPARKSSGPLGFPNVSPRGDQSRTPSGSMTPKDEKKLFHVGGGSPNNGSHARSHSQPPFSEDRGTLWKPAATPVGSGRKSPGPQITPEEFVQQRASSSGVASPVFAHHKKRSTGKLTKERPVSTEWSKRKEVGSRPSSGDVSAVLAEQRNYSNRLSAREQEHLARMTNSPLVNVSSRRNQEPQAAGLVGAIEAREQEKRQVRQGISGQMVQHAIAQKQQQAQQQHQAYQRQMAYQQAQQQAQHQAQQRALSPPAQAYQAQMATGSFEQPRPPLHNMQSSPEGRTMQPSPQPWPNEQTQPYWGGMQPQPQRQMQRQQRGQHVGSGKQGYVRKPIPGQK